MPSKKPAAKLKKVKKTVLKKAEPAKKSAASRRPAAPAMSAKPAAKKKAASVKTTSKPAAKLSQIPKTTPKTPKHQQTAKEPAVKPPAAKAEPASKKTASKSPVPPHSAPTGAKAPLSPTPAQTPAAASRTPPVRAIATSSSMSNSNSQYSAAAVAADADDSDGADGNINLLAGPRNVKPYIPRRGEQYMSKEQLDHFQQILLSWKNDLMEEVDRTVLHMKDEAANFPDPNDRATQESEFSLELRTRDRERKLIRKIDEALKRIEDGTYGYCIETGEEIGIKRLEARPVATLSVEAQERRERREKQYGDRDDRYR